MRLLCLSVRGGVISIKDSSVFIENSLFDSNLAQSGGALSIEIDQNDVAIFNSVFTNNSAVNGGAIDLQITNSSEVLIKRCDFVKNNAAEKGGAINS